MFPAPLDTFLTITELDEAGTWFGPLFARKFGHPVPDYPYHVGIFYRSREGWTRPLSYLHFLPFGDILLVGGLCTDGEVFASMQPHERDAIRDAGGVMVHGLRYSFRRLADRCDAYFGYCGDPRAYEVDMQAGFVPTQHDKLIVHWHKPLDDMRRRALVAKANAIGPF